jgi:rubredoxin
MPKFQCEKCGSLYAGWAGSKICRNCGGKLKLISWARYQEEKKKLDEAEKIKYVK